MRAWVWDNPVVTKEFRGRMRGARAYWLLFGYLLLLSLTLFFAYLQWWNVHAAAMEAGGGAAAFTIGRTFFLTLFYAQALLVTLITPALTSGAISIEREQRTFEMLRATALSARAIATGKLASSVSFIVLLLTSSLPLVSLCFLLGGVSPGEVFFGYVLLVADAFLFGAIGLAWSAHAANTASATALSYGSVFLWFGLTFPFAVPALNGMSYAGYGLGFGALNPVGAVVGAVAPEHYYGWTLAGWVPALIVILSLGTVLVLACINRLEDDPAGRAWPLRLATLVFCGLTLFLSNGVIFSWNSLGLPGFAQMKLLMLLGLAAVMLFVPPLVTGDAVWGPPRRLLAGALSAGLPFALVLVALVVGLMFAAVPLGDPQMHTAWGFPGRRGGPLPPSLNRSACDAALGQAAALLVAVTVGLGGLGLLLSALLRNRWAAVTSLYLLIVLALALPYFSYATLSGRDAGVAMADPAINSLYLCPEMALAQISGSVSSNAPVTFGGYGLPFAAEYPVVRGMVGYGSAPFWAMTAALYLITGAAAYGVGRALLRPRDGRILKSA